MPQADLRHGVGQRLDVPVVQDAAAGFVDLNGVDGHPVVAALSSQQEALFGRVLFDVRLVGGVRLVSCYVVYVLLRDIYLRALDLVLVLCCESSRWLLR
jgi:hypothetical protein